MGTAEIAADGDFALGEACGSAQAASTPSKAQGIP